LRLCDKIAATAFRELAVRERRPPAERAAPGRTERGTDLCEREARLYDLEPALTTSGRALDRDRPTPAASASAS
jgi:hypothetical protein